MYKEEVCDCSKPRSPKECSTCKGTGIKPRLHCWHDFNPQRPPVLPPAMYGQPGPLCRVYCCQCNATADACSRLQTMHGPHLPERDLARLPLEPYIDGHAHGEACPGPKLIVQ